MDDYQYNESYEVLALRRRKSGWLEEGL